MSDCISSLGAEDPRARNQRGQPVIMQGRIMYVLLVISEGIGGSFG